MPGLNLNCFDFELFYLHRACVFSVDLVESKLQVSRQLLSPQCQLKTENYPGAYNPYVPSVGRTPCNFLQQNVKSIFLNFKSNIMIFLSPQLNNIHVNLKEHHDFGTKIGKYEIDLK